MTIERKNLKATTGYGRDTEECYLVALSEGTFLLGTQDPPWHPRFGTPMVDLARRRSGDEQLYAAGSGTPLVALSPEEAIAMGEKLIAMGRALIDNPLPVPDP